MLSFLNRMVFPVDLGVSPCCGGMVFVEKLGLSPSVGCMVFAEELEVSLRCSGRNVSAGCGTLDSSAALCCMLLTSLAKAFS